MSLENNGETENLEAQKTPEDEIIEKYLSFQSAGTKQDKLNRIREAMTNENIRAYAAALVEASKSHGWAKVQDAAVLARSAMQTDAETLKIPISVFGKDTSWAMLDLGQKYHFFLQANKDRQPAANKHADPFSNTYEASKLRQEVIDRQLAYQARRAYSGNFPKAKAWRKMVDQNQEVYTRALALLQDKGMPDGQLSYAQETKLGETLHGIATELSNENETSESNQHVDETVTQGQNSLSENASAATIENAVVHDHLNEEHVPAQTNASSEIEDAPDHNHTVAKEMRDSLRSLGGNASHEKNGDAHERKGHGQDSHESHDHGHEKHGNENHEHGGQDSHDHGHDDHGHGPPIKVEKFKYTSKGLLKAGRRALWFLPGTLISVTAWETAKTTWESLKGMWGVFWKLAKTGFSFKALNKSAEGGGGGGGHGHEKKDDHGGGHGKDHGGGHGHDAHGGGHGGGGHH